MAAGSVKSALVSVLASAVLDIQPGIGEEWIIHNIFHEDSVDLEFYDGTNILNFYSSTGKNNESVVFHLTNARRIRVKNTTAIAKLIGYDGVQTV